MVVTLIGYRGAGKSRVAGPLAVRLGWEAVDADAELERRAGRTIRVIFAEEGEAVFRALERDVLADLLGRQRTVIAAGGGAVLDADNRRRMCEAGPVVWLRATVDGLERRLAEDAAGARIRPDLTAAGGRREIEELLARREPLYGECAAVVIDTDDRSIEEVVEAIVTALGPHLKEGSGT